MENVVRMLLQRMIRKYLVFLSILIAFVLEKNVSLLTRCLCLRLGFSHPLCTCYDGFDGQYCEYEKETTKKSTRRSIAFIIISSIISLLMFIVTIQYVINWYNTKESEYSDASIDVDAPAENEGMHNSELIGGIIT